MQIKLDIKILIYCFIFFFTNQIKMYIALMIFAFFHEISHVIVGLLCGFKISSFEIRPIGFSVSFVSHEKDYNKKIIKGNILELKKIIIYMAGPACNLILALIFYHFNYKVDFVYMNLIIFLFNLIPIYPFDGGRIIKSSIYIFGGLRKADIGVKKISSISMVALLVVSSLIVIKVHNVGLLMTLLYVEYIGIKAVMESSKVCEFIEPLKKHGEKML